MTGALYFVRNDTLCDDPGLKQLKFFFQIATAASLIRCY
jgi:hypothetical protein